MFGFDEIFQETIERELGQRSTLTKLFRAGLKERGCNPSEKALSALVDAIQSPTPERTLINADIEEFECDRQYSDEQFAELLGEIVESLPGMLEKHLSCVDAAIEEISDNMSRRMFRDLIEQVDEMVRSAEIDRSNFSTSHNAIWGKSLDLLDFHIHFSIHTCQYISNQCSKTNVCRDSYWLQVISRLQVRACRTALDILALLRAGFADGAHARWRSLHELAVVTTLIALGGEELAERYAKHGNIDTLKSAQKFYATRGSDRWPIENHRNLKSHVSEVAKLKSSYGDQFTTDYGWASKHLRMKNPRFSDIESFVGMAHYRPYYHLAGLNIHASSRCQFESPSIPQDSLSISYGPSNYGVAEPAHSTAITLTQCIGAVLTSEDMPDLPLDLLIALQTLVRISDEIGKRLVDAASELQPNTQSARTTYRRRLVPKRRSIKLRTR